MRLNIDGRLRLLSFPTLAILLALPLALLPLPYAVGIVLAVGGLLLTLIDPIWAVYAAVLSVPVQELITLPGGLSVTQASLLLALAALALHSLAHPARPVPFGPLFPPLALLLLALLTATAFTPYSRVEALRETTRWSTVALIYVLTLLSLGGGLGVASPPPDSFSGWSGRRRRPDQPESEMWGAAPPMWKLFGLLACLLLAPAVDAAVGLAQFWYGIGPESFGIGAGRVRAYGTIGQPNSFAGYLNQAWPLALSLTACALIWLWRGAPRRLGLALAAGLGGLSGLLLAGLLTSFSRGGWVGALGGGAAIALAAIGLLPARPRRAAWRGLALAGGVLALVIALGGGGLLPAPLAGRLGSIAGNLRLFDVRGVMITPENFAVVERMAHIQAGWNMFVRHPISGVGPGNYSIAFEHTPAVGEPPITLRPWHTSRGHAHNYYLNMAAEAGTLGLAAYLLLLGAVARQAVRAIRRARGLLWRGVAVGCAGISAALAVHNLFENLHVLNMGLQLGVTWALLVVVDAAGSYKRSPLL